MFGERYVAQLPQDPIEASKQFCSDTQPLFEDRINEEQLSLEDMQEIYVITVKLAGKLDEKVAEYISENYTSNNFNEVSGSLNRLCQEAQKQYSQKNLADLLDRYGQILENTYEYEITDGDLEKIQILINDMREILQTNESFDEDYKSRMFKRLENLQKELHKYISDFDKFWGLVGDAGLALGKFGENARPFVDRVRELAEVVWRTQARKEELPSGSEFPGRFLAENGGQEENGEEGP